jgi:hypothetical protein
MLIPTVFKGDNIASHLPVLVINITVTMYTQNKFSKLIIMLQ